MFKIIPNLFYLSFIVGFILCQFQCKTVLQSDDNSHLYRGALEVGANEIFKCSSSQSIPRSKVCDGIKDCVNGADELNCGSCDFKNNEMCGYHVSVPGNGDKLAYTFRFGNTTDGPKRDTKGGSDFMVAQAYRYTNSMEKSYLYSPLNAGSEAGCMVNFYYNMNGNISNVITDERWEHLSVSLNMTGYEPIKIWNSDVINVVPNVWLKGYALVGRVANPFQITFQASDKSPTDAPTTFGYVALANIQMINCHNNATPPSTCQSNEFQCRNRRCISKDYVGSDETNTACANYKLRCDFENGMCGWGQYRKNSWVITDGFSWLTNGPTRDHTKGIRAGKYLFMKSLYSENITSRISGPTIQRTGDCLLSFWLSIEGNTTNTGSLLIFTEDIYHGTYKTMWTLPNSEFPMLRFGFIHHQLILNGSWPHSFTLGFIGYLSGHKNSEVSYIAIDDITFSPECIVYSGQSSTTQSSTVRQSRVFSTTLSTISPSSNLSCNFESGTLCGWKNKLGNWAVISPADFTQKGSVSDLVPTRDHTLKNMRGHFAYIFHGGGDTIPSRSAIMTIEDNGVVVSGGPVCFTVWYYMRTNGEVELNVTAKAIDDSEDELIMRKRDHGDKWNKLQFETSIDKNSFVFEISALAKLGVVAIDDIRIENKSCVDTDQDYMI